MDFAKQAEVYSYVKENREHLPTIIQALVDGFREENQKLREGKSSVEAGLLVMLDKVDLSKLDKSYLLTLRDSLNRCTFLRVNYMIDRINKALEEAK